MLHDTDRNAIETTPTAEDQHDSTATIALPGYAEWLDGRNDSAITDADIAQANRVEAAQLAHDEWIARMNAETALIRQRHTASAVRMVLGAMFDANRKPAA